MSTPSGFEDVCCQKCAEGQTVKMLGMDMPVANTVMILCPSCGNKRCPKASDHRNYCTFSNRPGQLGSIYQ